MRRAPGLPFESPKETRSHRTSYGGMWASIIIIIKLISFKTWQQFAKHSKILKNSRILKYRLSKKATDGTCIGCLEVTHASYITSCTLSSLERMILWIVTIDCGIMNSTYLSIKKQGLYGLSTVLRIFWQARICTLIKIAICFLPAPSPCPCHVTMTIPDILVFVPRSTIQMGFST